MMTTRLAVSLKKARIIPGSTLGSTTELDSIGVASHTISGTERGGSDMALRYVSSGKGRRRIGSCVIYRE